MSGAGAQTSLVKPVLTSEGSPKPHNKCQRYAKAVRSWLAHAPSKSGADSSTLCSSSTMAAVLSVERTIADGWVSVQDASRVLCKVHRPRAQAGVAVPREVRLPFPPCERERMVGVVPNSREGMAWTVSRLFIWGIENVGELGLGSKPNEVFQPTTVDPAGWDPFRSVVVGSTPSRCLLRTDYSSHILSIWSHLTIRFRACITYVHDIHLFVFHVTISQNGSLSGRCPLGL